MQKLEWMNGVYIRELDLEDFYQVALPRWQKAGFFPEEVTPELKEYALRILEELQSRVKLLAEVVDYAKYFFTDDYSYNQEVVEKILTKPQTEAILRYVHKIVASVPKLDEEHVKPLFQAGLKKFDIKMGDIIQPIRVAVTGTNVSPGIYDVLDLLGRERILARIERTLQLLAEKELNA